MMNMKEKWKTIECKNIRDDYYEVSNYGNIRRKFSKKKIKITTYENDYSTVTLFTNDVIINKNGYITNKRIKFDLHTIVFIMFGPKKDVKKYLKFRKNKKYVVNHIDLNKSNSNISNLELTTPKGNTKHAIDNGAFKIGEKSTSSFEWIDNKIVNNICKYLDDGYTTKEIILLLNLDNYGCTNKQLTQLITSIYNGKNWKHISENYSFNNSKYTRSRSHNRHEIEYVCKLLENGEYSIKDIAIMVLNEFKVIYTKKDINKYKCFVRRIKERKSHQYISEKYNF